MNWVIALNSVLLAFAVVAGAGVKPLHERRVAVICAATLFPVWAVCTMCFNISTSPARLLGVRSADIWSVMDMGAGLIVAAIAIGYWWGRALWLSFVVQVALHVARWEFNLVERGAYYNALDFVFYAQVSLFVVIGGRGVANSIFDAVARSRRLPPVLRVVSGKPLSHVR